MLQRKFKYIMIFYRSLTQKTPFEASLFWMPGTTGRTRGKLFPILFSGGCHLLQISLKALFKYWKFHFPQLRAEWKKIMYTKWSPVTEEKSDFLCRNLLNVRQTITVSRAELSEICLWRLYKFVDHIDYGYCHYGPIYVK